MMVSSILLGIFDEDITKCVGTEKVKNKDDYRQHVKDCITLIVDDYLNQCIEELVEKWATYHSNCSNGYKYKDATERAQKENNYED